MGDSASIAQQQSTQFWLQGNQKTGVGATVNGNGEAFETFGFNGALLVTIVEQAGGTATITLEGSTYKAFEDELSATDAYNIGYTTLSVTPRAVSVSAISVTAHMRATFLIVDPYPWTRAVLSAVAGGAAVAVKLYAVPA